MMRLSLRLSGFIVLLLLGLAGAAHAASITAIAATDSQIKVTLNNTSSQSLRIYPVPIYATYNSASPGTAVWTGTTNGTVSFNRLSGSTDLLYSGFQLTDTANAAQGVTQYATDLGALTRVSATDSERWRAAGGGLNLGVANSIATMTFFQPSGTFDPILESPEILHTGQGRYLKVRCRLTNPEAANMTLGVYSFGGSGVGYGATTVTAGGAWQTVTIDMTTITGDTWAGDRWIRLDPADGAPDATLWDQATFDIDWIAVTNNTSFDGSIVTGQDYFWNFLYDGNLTPLTPLNSKGVTCIVDQNDAVALGLKHADTNVVINELVDWDNSASFYTYWNVDGTNVRIDLGNLAALDAQIRTMTDNGIDTLLILNNSVPTTANPSNPFIHPNTNLASAPNHLGAFNLTSQTGYINYRAAVEFLAYHYSEPSGRYGRVSGLIVGNELDAHWEWYNIGLMSMANFITDYVRALRITDLAVRRYNPNMKAYISLTHFWNTQFSTDNNKSFKGKSFIDSLNTTVTGAGNFPWAVAYHPYPENATAFWNDSNASMSFTSNKITFKNIEVLPVYMSQSTLQYGGKPRTVELTEQGFNQAGTTQQAQAAVYCYAWHKLNNIPGIRSFILHRHVDHRLEGGALFGIWTCDPVDPDPSKPVAKKLIYDCVLHGDKSDWRTYFDPYLSYLPQTTWDALMPYRTLPNFTFEDRSGGLSPTDGWTATNQMSTLTYGAGFVTSTSSGGDPNMEQSKLWFHGSAVPKISVLLKTAAGTQAKFYWKSTTYTTYNETRTRAVTLINDGKYHLYTFDFGGGTYWNDQIITSLRFDPTDAAGAIGIGYILAGTPAEPRYHFGVNTEGWRVANQLDDPVVYDGNLILHSNGTDPFMVNTEVDFAGSSRNRLSVCMSTAAGATGQLYWITSDDPNWSESKSQQFAITSDGNFNTYTMDLSGNALWAGKEIIGLRLDPTVAAGNVFIDYIELKNATTLLTTGFESGEGWAAQASYPTTNWSQTIASKVWTSNLVTGAEAWWVRGSLPAGTAHGGTGMVSVRAGAELITPAVNAPGLLTFWMNRSDNYAGLLLSVQKRVGSGDWTTLKTVNSQDVASANTFTKVAVPVNDTSSNVSFRLLVNYCATGNISIDDLTVEGM